MKRWLVAAGLIMQLCVPRVAAAAVDAITADDADAIQDAVSAQMEALSRDDAGTAFSLATQERRREIGSADDFLRMMKKDFSPIYRHLGLIFSSPQAVDGETIQVVRVTDGAGKVWLAVFWMLREADGSWKIDDCHLLGTNAVAI